MRNLYYYPASSCFPDQILLFCHSHENGNPVLNLLDSRVRGNDNHAKRICLVVALRGSVKKYPG